MPVFKWLILSIECFDDRILHHTLEGKSTNTPVWAKALKPKISILAITFLKKEKVKIMVLCMQYHTVTLKNLKKKQKKP